jgi:predicted nucleic acid-binding protein
MRVLLDTCILSELYKPRPLEAVKNALDAIDDNNLYLSVITIGEIKKGIELLPISKRKSDLENWFNHIEKNYCQKILSIDAETANIWGEITAKAKNQGFSLAIADGLIAATAIRHGLHLMTRNVKDFDFTSVLLLNPWE